MTWSQQYDDDKYRFGLVFAPDDVLEYDGSVTLGTDLCTADEFAVVLADQTRSYGGTAWEPTYDAVNMVADGVNNPLKLSWRPLAVRVVVLFTDERAQSYQTPTLTEADVTATVLSNGVIVYAFVDLGYASEFDDFVLGSGGSVYDIHMSEEDMVDELNNIVKLMCSR
jgi:hypothetical protein